MSLFNLANLACCSMLTVFQLVSSTTTGALPGARRQTTLLQRSGAISKRTWTMCSTATPQGLCNLRKPTQQDLTFLPLRSWAGKLAR
eukprot:3084044-Rhodomonas_salina.1